MANFLQALGLAQPTNFLNRTISAIQGMQLSRQQQALNQIQMTEALQRLKQNEQTYNLKMQQYQDAQKPIAVETVLQGMPGGLNTPMAAFAKQWGVSAGFVDPNAGTIRKADIPKFQQSLVKNPLALSKLNQITINYWREAVSELNNQLLKKPNDQNVQLKLKEAHDQLNKALYRDEYARKQLEAQKAQERAILAQKRARELANLKHLNKMAEIKAGKPWSTSEAGVKYSKNVALQIAKLRRNNGGKKTLYEVYAENHPDDPHPVESYLKLKHDIIKGGPREIALQFLIKNKLGFLLLPYDEQEKQIDTVVKLLEGKKKPPNPGGKDKTGLKQKVLTNIFGK